VDSDLHPATAAKHATTTNNHTRRLPTYLP
jgi:hypothetical protein